MIVKVIDNHGISAAAFGLGLSFGKTSGLDARKAIMDYEFDEIPNNPVLHMAEVVMPRLSGKGNGHDKFLRMMIVWLDITAPFYWWKEFDTYKVGTVAQSESTMHTIMSREFEATDFEGCHTRQDTIDYLNATRKEYLWHKSGGYKFDMDACWRSIIENLPMSYLQRRIVVLNYAVLQNIIRQRTGHKLTEWKTFIDSVRAGVNHPEFLSDAMLFPHKQCAVEENGKTADKFDQSEPIEKVPETEPKGIEKVSADSVQYLANRMGSLSEYIREIAEQHDTDRDRLYATLDMASKQLYLFRKELTDMGLAELDDAINDAYHGTLTELSMDADADSLGLALIDLGGTLLGVENKLRSVVLRRMADELRKA